MMKSSGTPEGWNGDLATLTDDELVAFGKHCLRLGVNSAAMRSVLTEMQRRKPGFRVLRGVREAAGHPGAEEAGVAMKLPWPFSESAFRRPAQKIADRIGVRLDPYRTAPPRKDPPKPDPDARMQMLQNELDSARAAFKRADALAIDRSQVIEQQVRQIVQLRDRIEVLRQALADIVTGNAMPPNVPVPDGILHAANEALKADDRVRKEEIP